MAKKISKKKSKRGPLAKLGGKFRNLLAKSVDAPPNESGKSDTGGAEGEVTAKDSANSQEENDATPKKKKKKPGLLTRLLTEPVPAASDDPDDEDEDSKEEDDAPPKKMKPGFLARLLTKPVPASSDDADNADSDEGPLAAPRPDAAKSEVAAPDSAGDKAESLTTEAFESQLQELLDQHGKVLAGKVQFIDLSDAKSKFPDRSEDITETLHTMAAKVIRSNVAKGDVYPRLQDSHLVVFAGLDAARARQRCVQITKEISELLEGQGVDTSGIVAKSVVGEVKGRAELEELSVEEAPPEPADSGADDAEPIPPKEVNVRT